MALLVASPGYLRISVIAVQPKSDVFSYLSRLIVLLQRLLFFFFTSFSSRRSSLCSLRNGLRRGIWCCSRQMSGTRKIPRGFIF